MKNRKLPSRLLALALCLCMVLGLMPSVQLVADAVAAQNQTATIDTGAAVTLTDADGDGCYDIDTADKLFAFAALVNGGSPAADAELTADIVINANVLNSSGTDANSGVQYRAWTPIGSQDNQYTGTFNGAGHTISGLYGSYSEDYIGLFGYVGQGGTVENLGVIDSAVYGSNSQYGGIIAGRNDGTVRNCYAAGVITGSLAIAGMVGYNTGSITNGFVAVTARGGSMIAPLIGWNQGGTVQNCYYLSESDVGAGFGWQNGTVDSKTGHKTPAQFASGEVAYLLGSGWGQSIGTDSRPVLGGRTVYAATYCHDGAFAGYYTNDADNTVVHNSFDANGICTHCGEGYRNAEQNASGVYEIGNLGQLIWFAQYVNAGNKGASAVLTADIDMSGYDWTPIASTGLYYNTTSYPDAGYTGTFDGQGHVISNLSVTGSSSVDGSYGLFGTVSGTVKNLGINNFRFTGGGMDTRVGAVVGQMLNGSRVENCYATNININTQVNTNNGVAGGIAGCNYAGIVSDCYTYNVNITAARLGGIVGDNCGDISATDRMGTMEKCYTSHIYLRDPSKLGNALSGEAGVSAEWFASGEITWLLNGSSSNGVWKQTVGSGLPAFSGGTVYRVLGCDGKTMTYSNSSTSPKAHSFVNNICTFCGVYVDGVVVSVSKNGIVTGAYTTLNDAIQVVRNCTAADKAVVTILQDIALGDSYQKISSGVFTIDLNGHEISNTNTSWGALYISGSATNVTIQGTGENSKITGNYAGIEMSNGGNVTIAGGTVSGNDGVHASNSTVTVSGGTISGDCGVNAFNSTVTVSGGTISGEFSVYAFESTVTISGGTISGEFSVYAYESTVTISGGSISSNAYDIACLSSTVTLTVDEDGVGATFPGGIEVSNTTLNAILGEGAAYWQGNTMITPANNATEITGGDVVIKAECKHTGEKTYTNNGDDHSYLCSGCNNTITESHTYTNCLCVCGAVSPDAVASVSKNGTITGAYSTLNDAIQAVANCTADDKAVVTILQNIALGDGNQKILSGVFTIDLNGHEISSTKTSQGALYITGSATDVTIQGAGENSKIIGNYAGIEMYNKATLTITGGTIIGRYGVYAYNSDMTISSGTVSGGSYGVYAHNSNATISDGTISGGSHGVYAYNSNATISDGTIGGDDYGVYASNSTVTISGGSISGNYCVDVFGGTVTISGGTITGEHCGVNAYENAVTISDGTVSGDNYGVYAYGNSTVTISGGSISSDNRGVYASGGTVTISGGSISGGTYDIYNYESTITLTVGENGVGATFPGGIKVYDTTLNEILDEGASCWQGNTMILPADDATSITGGDVVIKAECKHTGEKTYTNNGDDHSYLCSGCNNTITESHTYTNCLCICGAVHPDMVASVSKNGIVTGVYTTLNDAIQAVANCTADDKAVVTILKDIALGDSYQEISFGVFTIDLNGHEISSTKSNFGALYINGADIHVTIQGAGENSKITGNFAGIEMAGATLTVISGTISGNKYGVNASISTVTISGGTISGNTYGIIATNSTVTISGGTISSGYEGMDAYESTVTISDGTISGNTYGIIATNSTVTISGGTISGGYEGVSAYESTVTISGGSISSDYCDIYNSYSTVTLTLGEDGVGATFPGGITVGGTTLNAILGEGAAYWQGDKQINPADDATEITGGDVVIKAYVAPVYSGWTEIDGDWYYYDPDTGKPVTGITRVPYPTEAINGVTYAPDQESIDYAASKGQTFIDETTGLFWFDTDGKFLSSYTGIVPSEDGPSQYAVNGMIPWHVGLVQIGEDYYYFTGNTELGGNVLSTGDVYAIRNTTALNVVLGGVYTFGEDGALCKYEGITEVNGTLRYYENYRLMAGNGLTKVGQNYIYVRSNGELVADSDYYIPENDLNIASGTYRFDENGYMIQPVSTDKDGVYFENGAWYYYENGKIACNKGLICVNTSWHGADGSENVYSGYVYVRSSGVLATGTYYITNVSNDVSGLFTTGMKVLFDENGIADAPKNGIYEIDGELYYFVGNQIQYNAGLIEYNGGWIYVRSNGKLAVGDYWITNTNGYLTQGGYEFGVDGYMIISEAEDGIVSANGVLYYYEDGKKQYGLGLRQLEDGSYIYVRTNGQLATGSYWITNHNGLLPEGLYTFGDNGIMIEN